MKYSKAGGSVASIIATCVYPDNIQNTIKSNGYPEEYTGIDCVSTSVKALHGQLVTLNKSGCSVKYEPAGEKSSEFSHTRAIILPTSTLLDGVFVLL